MDEIEKRAPKRERDRRGMPARTGTLALGGWWRPYRTIQPLATVTPRVDPAEPTTGSGQARHDPGFILFFRADDGKVYAGRVPGTSPVEAMAHPGRGFSPVPSARDPERPDPFGSFPLAVLGQAYPPGGCVHVFEHGPGSRSVPEGASTGPRRRRARPRAGD